MANEFRTLTNDARPIESLSRAQLGLILGLERVLREAGLVLTCPRCAVEGHAQLQTQNTQADEIWKIDCPCRRRRSARIASMMVPTGWLLLLVPDLLTPISLDVRCPSKRCLLKPLEMHQSADGLTLTVTCQCGRLYRFQKTKTTKPH